MTEPLVCACRTFEIPNGYGLYEDGFIHTVDCCPVVRLRDLTKPPPTTPSDAAMRAAEEIVPDCLSRTCFIRDSHRNQCWGCDDSRTERERVAAIITRNLPVPVVNRLFEAKLLGFGESDRIRLCGPCMKRATEDDFVIFGCALPLDAAATTSPETPVGGETELYAAFDKHLAQRHEELATAMRETCTKVLDLIEQYTRPDFYMWLLHDHAGQQSDPYKRATEAKKLLTELLNSKPSNRAPVATTGDNEGDSQRTSIHRKDCGMPDCFICYGSKR